jgi:hypothetical protein
MNETAIVPEPQTAIAAPVPELTQSITGDEEKIPELKKLLDSYNICPHLKAHLAGRLDHLKSNAASIHFHDVPRRDGGWDTHISVRPKHHGKSKMSQGLRVPA